MVYHYGKRSESVREEQPPDEGDAESSDGSRHVALVHGVAHEHGVVQVHGTHVAMVQAHGTHVALVPVYGTHAVLVPVYGTHVVLVPSYEERPAGEDPYYLPYLPPKIEADVAARTDGYG